MNILKIGARVLTSYDSGPYRITKISGPCTCPPFVAVINNLGREDQIPPSDPHYHLTCRWAGAVFPGREPLKTDFYLNGYRADGTNVWNDDTLTLEGYEPGTTDDLFGAAA